MASGEIQKEEGAVMKGKGKGGRCQLPEGERGLASNRGLRAGLWGWLEGRGHRRVTQKRLCVFSYKAIRVGCHALSPR